MIEITVLVFLILLFIKPLAQARGESVLKWSLFAISAWVAAEVLLGAAIGLILLWRRVQLQSTVAVIFIVLLLYATASCAALLVVRALRKKPVSSPPVTSAE